MHGSNGRKSPKDVSANLAEVPFESQLLEVPIRAPDAQSPVPAVQGQES